MVTLRIITVGSYTDKDLSVTMLERLKPRRKIEGGSDKTENIDIKYR